MAQHDPEEILAVLDEIPMAAVATSAGQRMRNRMMHFAADKDFTIYLASMKGDPKTVQITRQPSVALLIHKDESSTNINGSQEIEIQGKAVIVHDDAERKRALELTAKRSPVVKYLTETGNAQVLDCIKVAPETVKYRVFGEIVQGQPPTVLEFHENRLVTSDWQLLKAKAQNWFTGIRAPFLTASLVPLLLGGAIGWAQTGQMLWNYFFLTLIAGIAMQVGANVINDYFDYRSGNDDTNKEYVRPFSGGSRVIQLGLLTPLETLILACLALFVASAIGLYLVWARGPFILALGAIGLLSSWFYTGRPFNWASRGFGEAVVGVNFGPLMTLGAFYMQTGEFSWVPIIAAVPLGLFIAAVLYINEFPDYHADKAVGKNTLVVRLGREKAVAGFAGILVLAYAVILGGVITGVLPALSLIALLTVPASVRAFLYARQHHSSSFDLIPANASTVIGHLALGLLLTAAYAWQALGAQGLIYGIAITLAFLVFTVYFYWYTEHQKNIFLGLRQAMR